MNVGRSGKQIATNLKITHARKGIQKGQINSSKQF
jgi:hypothetical protein